MQSDLQQAGKQQRPVLVSKYFQLEELVPKETFQAFGESSIWFLDKRLLTLADFVRDYFKAPVYINNWLWGGIENYRGYRPPTSTVGATQSQHRFGRAFDCSVKDLSPNQVYDTILKNPSQFISNGLTCMENILADNSHVHMDIRWTNSPTILIVNP